MSLNFLINKISGQGAGRSLFDSKVTRKNQRQGAEGFRRQE